MKALTLIVTAVSAPQGEKFVENDLFMDFGEKCKVRNGAVVFQKTFVK